MYHPEMAIEGNYDQHLANGGCPVLHHNGKWFCQGRLGHYNYFTSRHWTKVVTVQGGRPVETQGVEWN